MQPPHHNLTSSPHHNLTSSPTNLTQPHHNLMQPPHHNLTSSPHHNLTSSPTNLTQPHHNLMQPRHHNLTQRDTASIAMRLGYWGRRQQINRERKSQSPAGSATTGGIWTERGGPPE
jgi:hypothetical protein